jgi:hypothetical protein
MPETILDHPDFGTLRPRCVPSFPAASPALLSMGPEGLNLGTLPSRMSRIWIRWCLHTIGSFPFTACDVVWGRLLPEISLQNLDPVAGFAIQHRTQRFLWRTCLWTQLTAKPYLGAVPTILLTTLAISGRSPQG